jgi:hypothetical protein
MYLVLNINTIKLKHLDSKNSWSSLADIQDDSLQAYANFQDE